MQWRKLCGMTLIWPAFAIARHPYKKVLLPLATSAFGLSPLPHLAFGPLFWPARVMAFSGTLNLLTESLASKAAWQFRRLPVVAVHFW